MSRIVSLLPSTTEMVFALGRGHELVGRSHECDYPAGVEALPVCCESKLSMKGSAREVHDRVQQLIEETLSVYRVNAEALKTLAPDVLLTQDHCQVCAVSLEEVQAALKTWLGRPPVIVALKPDALADVWQGLKAVASALGCDETADQLIRQYETRMRAIAQKTASLASRPGVACIEWMEPLMCAGNWVPELLDMAGGRDLFGRAGEHAPRLDWAKIRAADPEVLIVMCCGWSLEKNEGEMPVLTRLEGWSSLKAVRSGQVYLTDGHQYFNRPGPRLVESLEILAEILHPGLFSFGHEGSGWKKFV